MLMVLVVVMIFWSDYTLVFQKRSVNVFRNGRAFAHKWVMGRYGSLDISLFCSQKFFVF
jgi:hypothetical protein